MHCCFYTNTVTLDLTPYHPPQSFNAVHPHERNLSPWFFLLRHTVTYPFPANSKLSSCIVDNAVSTRTPVNSTPYYLPQSFNAVHHERNYFLGSFFSDIHLPRELQTSLLEQALRNLTRSLHNQEL
jgi:hypothetical protein